MKKTYKRLFRKKTRKRKKINKKYRKNKRHTLNSKRIKSKLFFSRRKGGNGGKSPRNSPVLTDADVKKAEAMAARAAAAIESMKVAAKAVENDRPHWERVEAKLRELARRVLVDGEEPTAEEDAWLGAMEEAEEALYWRVREEVEVEAVHARLAVAKSEAATREANARAVAEWQRAVRERAAALRAAMAAEEHGLAASKLEALKEALDAYRKIGYQGNPELLSQAEKMVRELASARSGEVMGLRAREAAAAKARAAAAEQRPSIPMFDKTI